MTLEPRDAELILAALGFYKEEEMVDEGSEAYLDDLVRRIENNAAASLPKTNPTPPCTTK